MKKKHQEQIIKEYKYHNSHGLLRVVQMHTQNSILEGLHHVSSDISPEVMIPCVPRGFIVYQRNQVRGPYHCEAQFYFSLGLGLWYTLPL